MAYDAKTWRLEIISNACAIPILSVLCSDETSHHRFSLSCLDFSCVFYRNEPHVHCLSPTYHASYMDLYGQAELLRCIHPGLILSSAFVCFVLFAFGVGEMIDIYQRDSSHVWTVQHSVYNARLSRQQQ